MNIYSDFKPTFLYLKQHSKTGLLYFGKTTRNPETYPGSGTYWQKHYKKHGKKFITTLWYCLFLSKEECETFALNFSTQNDIVKSEAYANLMEENGLDGGAPKGRVQSLEERKKRSMVMKNKPLSKEHIQNLKGKIRSAEYIEAMRKRRSRPCTIDGTTIFKSLKDLIAVYGQGCKGSKSPTFRFTN